MAASALIDAIDAELPQTQCGKCSYNGCRPYAEAIVAGDAINRCPPGGVETLNRLAELTGRATLPLEQPPQPPTLALIREDECIGCTKCIQACPVDAIVGAAKQMHTVIEDECTGCELCVAPCPVDCIDLVPHPQWQAANTDAEQTAYLEHRAIKGRERFIARNQRLAAQAEAKRQRRAQRSAAKPLEAPKKETPTASLASPSALRANRARQAAALKRLERKLETEQDSAKRDELAASLETQRRALEALDATLNEANAGEPATAQTQSSATRRHQKRMALKAAEQSLRHVRQQLSHAKRQGTAADVARVEEQLHQAQQVVDAAHQALESETSS
ncbi:RnfABCDGE type electron transport complex subunit B [Vreelandella sp. EE7]